MYQNNSWFVNSPDLCCWTPRDSLEICILQESLHSWTETNFSILEMSTVTFLVTPILQSCTLKNSVDEVTCRMICWEWFKSSSLEREKKSLFLNCSSFMILHRTSGGCEVSDGGLQSQSFCQGQVRNKWADSYRFKILLFTLRIIKS